MSTEPVVMPSLTSGMDESWLTLTQEESDRALIQPAWSIGS